MKRLINYILVEAVTRGFDLEEDPAMLEKVGEICGFRANIPLKEIEVERYVELLNWLSQHFYPEKPEVDGLFEVGKGFYRGYEKTILGRVQLAAKQRVDPGHILLKFTEMSDKNTNFGTRWVTKIDPQHYQVFYRQVPLPPSYVLGIVKGFLDEQGITETRLTWQFINNNPEDIDFDIAWSE